jgi:hypothetical protein
LEFVQHAGAGNGKVDNPLRHIVMSPTPTQWVNPSPADPCSKCSVASE